MKITLPTLRIERLALRLHETLRLAISIVIGAVHGRAEANELFSNAVLRRIETIATKNVSPSAPSFGANLLTMENGNAMVVNIRGHVSPTPFLGNAKKVSATVAFFVVDQSDNHRASPWSEPITFVFAASNSKRRSQVVRKGQKKEIYAITRIR